MSEIGWKESYSVHIDLIDGQHKQLFALIEKLQQGIEQDRDREIIREIIFELVHYTEYHFSAEEELMRRYKYPAYEAHKAEHTRFIKEVRELIDDMVHGKVALSDKALNFLNSWIVSHIGKVDQRLAPFLKAHGVGA